MYLKIYAMPISHTLLLLFFAVILWTVVRVLLSAKAPGLFRPLSLCLFLLWCGAALTITLFSREPTLREVSLLPFRQLIRFAQSRNPEILRMLWMNMLLFFPAGLLLPDVFGVSELKKAAFLSLLFGAVFGFIIESAQWIFALGLAETDDILTNTLGALAGAGTWGFSLYLIRIIRNKRKVKHEHG